MLSVLALALVASAPQPARPILVTIDDLPLQNMHGIPGPDARKRVTEQMLRTLEKHGIEAIGLVTWGKIKSNSDRSLLELWLQGGHELGNHSFGHLDYTRTDQKKYIADIERARRSLAAFLKKRGKKVRFFRFPFLREGDTKDKLDAMRAYLKRSGQRDLPVTIDNQDWSFEEPWLKAKPDAKKSIADAYHFSLDMAVEHHERRSDKLFSRPVPQILLLHANAVGAAQWDRLFTRLKETGHRFATADEVLKDPVFAIRHESFGPRGFSHWDWIGVDRDRARVTKELTDLLKTQAADWTRGDLEAFCAVYAEDATFVAPSGISRGRDQILKRYKKKYRTKALMGALALEVQEVRLQHGFEVSRFGDAVPSKIHGATVILKWTLSYPKKSSASGHSLVVVRPTLGGWEIVQDASM